ncbi:MAG: energy transducer TonB [Stenotrophobium sp.]
MRTNYHQPFWNLRDAAIMGLIVGLHAVVLWRITHMKPPPAQPQQVILQVSMVKPPDELPPPPKIERVQPQTTQKVTQQVMQDLPPVITDIPVADPIPEPPANPAPPQPSAMPPPKNTGAGRYLIAKQEYKPIYPRKALRDGIEGTVTLLIHVDQKGVPEKVEVVKSSGDFDLDNAARYAAMKYLFVPAMQNGVPVTALGLLDIVFKLDDSN